MTSAYLLLEKRDECTVRDIRAHQLQMIAYHERRAEMLDALAQATTNEDARRIAYEIKIEHQNAASRIRFAIAMTMTSQELGKLQREADQEKRDAEDAEKPFRIWQGGQ